MLLAALRAAVVEEAARVSVDALAANGGREPELVPVALIPEMRERFRAGYGQGVEGVPLRSGGEAGRPDGSRPLVILSRAKDLGRPVSAGR